MVSAHLITAAAGKGGVTIPPQVVIWAIILLVVYLIGRKHGGS